MSDSGQQTLESMSQANWYNQWTLNKLKQYLKGDILEVGCGIGNFTRSLEAFGKIWAIDINNDYVNETKKLVKGKSRVGLGDVEQGEYFFKDQKFDSIICLNVLEHIKDDVLALNNLYSLLKVGGFLILLVPAHQFLFGEIDRSIGHFRRYDKQQIKQTLKSIGFTIIKVRTLNMLGAIGWWFAAKVFANRKVDENKIRMFNLVAPVILPLEDIIEPPFGTSILFICQKSK